MLTGYTMKVAENVTTTCRDHETGFFSKVVLVTFKGTKRWHNKDAAELALVLAIRSTKELGNQVTDPEKHSEGVWSFRVTNYSD